MRGRALWAVAAVSAVLTAGTVTGCGLDTGNGDTGGNGKVKAVDGSGFPVEVTDCSGKRTEIADPPERIVTGNAAALALLVRLGVGDRVIGTGFPPGDGTLPGKVGEQAERVPVLGKGVISKERLLASGADLYVTTFVAGAGHGGADRPTGQEFDAVGMDRVVTASTACASSLNQPQENLTGVEEDIMRLGRVTGTADRAAELVARMERELTPVRNAVRDIPAEDRPSYFFFDHDAGTDQPSAMCNRQVGHAVLTEAGARNLFSDCDAAFERFGWEKVVSADPDWIQLGIRDRGSKAANRKAFQEAEDFLRDFPATSGLTAVRKGRFLRIGSEQTTLPSVRNADTVRRIAETLHPDALPKRAG